MNSAQKGRVDQPGFWKVVCAQLELHYTRSGLNPETRALSITTLVLFQHFHHRTAVVNSATDELLDKIKYWILVFTARAMLAMQALY